MWFDGNYVRSWCVDGKVTDSMRGKVARSITFRELAVATQNFKETNLIGEGGFGRVYKGCLESGKVRVYLFYF